MKSHVSSGDCFCLLVVSWVCAPFMETISLVNFQKVDGGREIRKAKYLEK